MEVCLLCIVLALELVTLSFLSVDAFQSFEIPA